MAAVLDQIARRISSKVAGKPIARWHSLAQRRAGASRGFQRIKGQSGYALVAVIWTLGLIALLGMAVMVGARYRAKTTTSLALTERAAAAAESAINLAIVQTIATPVGPATAFPLRCRMPDGEWVTVSILDEVGKVDLNTATPEVLMHLFGALIPDQSKVKRIVQRIIAFRQQTSSRGADIRSASQKPGPARNGDFATVLQLDQIEDISPALFRAVLPFVTVRSGRSGPDAAAASPALREVLKLDHPAAPPALSAPPGPRNMTIRADVVAEHGARFIRTALVSFGADTGKPYLVHEWRRGEVESVSHSSRLPSNMEAPAKSCFQLSKRAAANG